MTEPALPAISELLPYLEQIWESGQVTNGGPLHNQFEEALSKHLGVDYVSLFNNCTTALIAGLRALNIRGEVITTPYTFSATTNAIYWNNLTPVFVDIDPDTLNLDPALTEQAITKNTAAILPVHVYGAPCDTAAFENIAGRYQLKLIYDAAHAFGVRCHCGSLLSHGDLSVVSFHATKAFSTIEGGAVVSCSKDLKHKVDSLRNFGTDTHGMMGRFGLNGKMSEISAAIGLLQLSKYDDHLARRRLLNEIYIKRIKSISGISYSENNATVQNYSYFPIFINSKFPKTRDELFDELERENIICRKYFFPLATHGKHKNARKQNIQNAENASSSVICLPIHSGMKESDAHFVCDVLEKYSKNISVAGWNATDR